MIYRKKEWKDVKEGDFVLIRGEGRTPIEVKVSQISHQAEFAVVVQFEDKFIDKPFFWSENFKPDEAAYVGEEENEK